MVEGYCTVQRAWRLRIDGLPMLLGFWWMLVSVKCHHMSLELQNSLREVTKGDQYGKLTVRH